MVEADWPPSRNGILLEDIVRTLAVEARGEGCTWAAIGEGAPFTLTSRNLAEPLGFAGGLWAPPSWRASGRGHAAHVAKSHVNGGTGAPRPLGRAGPDLPAVSLEVRGRGAAPRPAACR